jgi:CopG family nickel-responsive transcriptional regulator
MVTLDLCKKLCGKRLFEVGREIMTGIVRVGVTFPPELLKDFDDVTGEMGYGNRSKAVQDAVRLFVSEKRWLRDERGNRAGVLMILYDHEARGLENELTRIQHHYAHVICSTMHIHLSERECLEAIAVKGNGVEIRRLSDELAARKGVKLSRTTVVAV